MLIKNLSTSNGTFVNGQLVTGSRRLEHKDIIELGGRCFRFEVPASDGGSAAGCKARGAGRGSFPRKHLKLSNVELRLLELHGRKQTEFY